MRPLAARLSSNPPLLLRLRAGPLVDLEDGEMDNHEANDEAN